MLPMRRFGKLPLAEIQAKAQALLEGMGLGEKGAKTPDRLSAASASASPSPMIPHWCWATNPQAISIAKTAPAWSRCFAILLTIRVARWCASPMIPMSRRQPTCRSPCWTAVSRKQARDRDDCWHQFLHHTALSAAVARRIAGFRDAAPGPGMIGLLNGRALIDPNTTALRYVKFTRAGAASDQQWH